MRPALLFSVLIFCQLTSLAQPVITAGPVREAKYDSMINFLKKYYRDFQSPPIFYRNHGGDTVRISDTQLNVTVTEILPEKPVPEGFPVSYSVIFRDRLIALFDPGYFAAYHLPSMERDTLMEKRLNTRKFQYHWILNDQLTGLSDGTNYTFSASDQWEPVSLSFKPWKKPKLFEDDKYICFRECYGEWGGKMHFTNKKTSKTNSFLASCANTVLKEDPDHYLVLSHGASYSDCLRVKDGPDLSGSGRLFNARPIGFYSFFRFNDKLLYLVHDRGLTFLAEVHGQTISIVHPLLSKVIWTHHPVTSVSDGTILINMDFYSVGNDREVSGLILRNDEIIRYKWYSSPAY